METTILHLIKDPVEGLAGDTHVHTWEPRGLWVWGTQKDQKSRISGDISLGAWEP